MFSYEYTVIDQKNAIYRGLVAGWTRRRVERKLQSHSVHIITLNRVAAQFSWGRSLFRHVSKTDRLLFLRNLMTMLKAGLSLTDALGSLKEHLGHPILLRMANQVEKDVLSGTPLSTAIARHPNVFSALTVAMIKIGERGGKLVETLEHLVQQQENEIQLLRRIRNALVYPVLIMVTMVGIVIVMMVMVIPKIALIYEEAEAALPGYTQALINVSDFVASSLVFVLVFLALSVAWFAWEIRHWPAFRRFVHRGMLRLPFVGEVLKKYNQTSIARSLAMLTHGGFSIDEGILLTADATSNVVYQEALREAKPFIRRGVKLSDVFKGRPMLFLPLFRKMVSTGEETGTLDDMFDHVARYYEGDIQHWTANVSTLIEPLLLLATGALVGGVALAVLFPLWNFANII